MGALAVAIAWRWALTSLNAPGATTSPGRRSADRAVPAQHLHGVSEYCRGPRGDRPRLSSRNRATPTRAALARGLHRGSPLRCRGEHEYAPMSSALLLIVIYRLGKKEPASVYVIESVDGGCRFMRFRWVVRVLRHLGKALPMAPYGSMTQTSPLNVRAAGPDCCSIRNTGCWHWRRSHTPRHGPVAHVDSRRCAAAPGDRNHGDLPRSAGHGWRFPASGGAARSAPSRPISRLDFPCSSCPSPRRFVPHRWAGPAAPRSTCSSGSASASASPWPGGIAGRPATQQRPRRHVSMPRITGRPRWELWTASRQPSSAILNGYHCCTLYVVAGDRGDRGIRNGPCLYPGRRPVGTGRGS